MVTKVFQNSFTTHMMGLLPQVKVVPRTAIQQGATGTTEKVSGVAMQDVASLTRGLVTKSVCKDKGRQIQGFLK